MSDLFNAVNTQVEIMFKLLVILKMNFMVGLLSGNFTVPIWGQSVDDSKCGTYCYCLMKSQVWKSKSKGVPQQAEVAQGVPGRLRPRIFLTFGTTRVAGCQP